MGIYQNLELEFVDRTLKLIDQYNATLSEYPTEEQFNYTLIINCLLGLVVMPKERVITYVSTEPITQGMLNDIGAPSLELGNNVTTLRDLISKLRHAVAHFDIEVFSENESQQIDWLVFSDSEKNALVARFRANELLPFLKYYGECLIHNIKQYRD